MKRARVVALCTAVVCLGLAAGHALAQKAPAAQPAPVSSHTQGAAKPVAAAPSQDHNAVIRRYCATCHSEARKAGGLSLAGFDVARAAQNAETAEKMIR